MLVMWGHALWMDLYYVELVCVRGTSHFCQHAERGHLHGLGERDERVAAVGLTIRGVVMS